MRSNGLATILLMIPILAIPALAIFGVPELTPLVESTFGETKEPDFDLESDSSAKSSRDDLFSDIEGFASDSDLKENLSTKRPEANSSTGKKAASRARRRRESNQSKWDDDVEDDDKASEKSVRQQAPRDAKDRLANALASPDDKEKSKPSENERRLKFKRQPQSAVDDANSKELSADHGRPSIKSRSDANPGDKAGIRKSDSVQSSESDSEQLTWNSAIERLNALDIHSFRLEPGKDTGQFVFICSYAPENNPQVSYRFEADASEPLKAIENVLAQIAEWQQHQ